MNIFGLHFQNWYALFLLAVIPAYIVYYLVFYPRLRLRVRMSIDPKKIHQPALNLSFLHYVPKGLQLLAITCFIIALARPQTRGSSTKRYSEGIDIMLLLDTSGSMETDDFKPNRLEVAKEKAAEFVNGRENDQIGIVLFAEDAFAYSPLTLDYAMLQEQIENISPKIMPKDGTAMGSAILVGLLGMEESKSKSKIMILLTDGESNRGQIDPVMAGKLAKDKGVKIYSIGVGKKEYTIQTLLGPQKIESPLDEETLKEISDETGGEFFRSTDERGLEKIFEKISQMERSEFTEEISVLVKDHYPIFLKIGIPILVLSFFGMVTFMHNPLEE